MSLKNPLTPAGIEPATFRFVAQHLNHCATAVPYIRHIWIKTVLCSRMVSLFLHTSPWTHRCLQCSHSAHRNGRVFRRSVQTACCYLILNCVTSSSNWNSQTNASRLWWSVCWCEYSKALGKVKSVVRKWFVVISVLMWVQYGAG